MVKSRELLSVCWGWSCPDAVLGVVRAWEVKMCLLIHCCCLQAQNAQFSVGFMCLLVWAVPGLCFGCCSLFWAEGIKDPGISISFMCLWGNMKCRLSKDSYCFFFCPCFGMLKIRMWSGMSTSFFVTLHWCFVWAEREDGLLMDVGRSEVVQCCFLCVAEVQVMSESKFHWSSVSSKWGMGMTKRMIHSRRKIENRSHEEVIK